MSRLPFKRPSFNRTLAALLCLIATVGLFQQALSAAPADDGAWQRIQQAGIWRVGVDASFPPFSDFREGKPLGLEIDLATEIGRRIGLQVEFVNMGFDGLYYALETGQVDALISTLTADPSKLGFVTYSAGYFDAGQLIGTRTDSRGAPALTQLSQLEGWRVAVEYGSGGDELLRIWERRLRVVYPQRFASTEEALTVVLSGTVEAALVDALPARLYRRTHPDLVLSQPVRSQPYRIALRTSTPGLIGAVGEAFRAMERDGTLAALVSRWLD